MGKIVFDNLYFDENTFLYTLCICILWRTKANNWGYIYITSRSCCKFLQNLFPLFKSFWWFSNCSRSNLYSIRRQWPWWQPHLVWCKFVWKQKKIWHHRALLEDNVETELEQSHPFKTTRAHGWHKPARLRKQKQKLRTETAMLRRRKFTFQNHSCVWVQSKLKNLRVICVLEFDGLKVAQKIMLILSLSMCKYINI